MIKTLIYSFSIWWSLVKMAIPVMNRLVRKKGNLKIVKTNVIALNKNLTQLKLSLFLIFAKMKTCTSSLLYIRPNLYLY